MIKPNDTITPILYFGDPEQAEAPLSANTETVICYTCFSDVNNCTAFYYTNTVPHPVYTNEFGKAVLQLDMVTLGGVNGLNN